MSTIVEDLVNGPFSPGLPIESPAESKTGPSLEPSGDEEATSESCQESERGKSESLDLPDADFDDSSSSDSESYSPETLADLLKLVKPFSIVLNRLPDDVLREYNDAAPCEPMEEADVIEAEEIQVEKIEEVHKENGHNSDDESMHESEYKVLVITDEMRKFAHQEKLTEAKDENSDLFFCFFCGVKDIFPFAKAVEHYQTHLDCYPYKCSICDEVLLNQDALIAHFCTTHPDEPKATFSHDEQPVPMNWIKKFLKSLSKDCKTKVTAIKRNCPVCECLVGKDTLELPIYANKALQLIPHIYKHLGYYPYRCSLCFQSGKEVVFSTLQGSRVTDHVLSKHEHMKDRQFADILGRSYGIPILDKYIEQFKLARAIKTRQARCNISKKALDRFERKRLDKLVSAALEKHADRKAPEAPSILNFLPKLIPKSDAISNGPPKGVSLLESASTLPAAVKPVAPVPKLIVNVSPSHTQYNGDLSIGNSFFCIFCPDNVFFTSKMEACTHIAEHLDYQPVVCLLCSSKFSDLDSLMKHHTALHSKPGPSYCDDDFASNLLYFVNEDQTIEKWIDDFLDFQLSYDLWSMISRDFRASCPVCNKLISECSENFVKLSNSSSPDHLYLHLRYFPYECMLCKSSNSGFKVSALDKVATDHLATHQELDASKTVADVFAKTATIVKLDAFLLEFSVKNATQINGLRSVKRNLVFEDTPEDAEIPDLLPPASNDISPSDKLVLSPTTNSPPSAEAAVTVPSSNALETSNCKLSHERVCCFHCHVAFENWPLLKRHHYTLHPSLSLVGYPPC